MSEAIWFPETRARAADRYMALWNEPEAYRRRRLIAEFQWETGADDGSTAAVGLNVLVLAAACRVQCNYTFVDGG